MLRGGPHPFLLALGVPRNSMELWRGCVEMGKKRCQEQCDLSLPAWALVGHPARRCHCRKAFSLVRFGFYLDAEGAPSLSAVTVAASGEADLLGKVF